MLQRTRKTEGSAHESMKEAISVLQSQLAESPVPGDRRMPSAVVLVLSLSAHTSWRHFSGLPTFVRQSHHFQQQPSLNFPFGLV